MQLLGYLFIGIFETAGLHYLSKNYLQLKKAAKIQFVLTHAIYILVTVLQVYCVYNAYLNTVVDFIMYIILVSCYNGSLYKKLLICAASEITFILSESIVLLSGQILTGIKFVNDVSFEKYMPLLCCITGLVGFLLIWLIIKLTYLYQKYKRHWFAGNLFLIFTLILLSIDLIVNFGKTQYLFYSLFIIFLLVIAVMICLDMFKSQLKVQRESMRTSFLEKQLALQIEHYESLYNQMHRIREIRHNVKNILINIDSYLSLGEIENAHEYINRYQGEVSSEDVVDSGVPLLDAILTAKRAAFNGEFRISMIPLTCNYINLADIGMMLAIALDNAVEGTKGIDRSYIIISIVQQSQMISIQIKNPTLNQPSSTYQFPPSTKADAINHGYGLKSCSRISKKWNGDMSWECSDGVFTLDIFVQDIPAIKE
ncbi:GHKL domain-containing protein [Butyricicoccus sp. 1XD8-22]|nr:GHKL domain-containing protein [Butyricicoccus sp. 1XD8-22]